MFLLHYKNGIYLYVGMYNITTKDKIYLNEELINLI